MTNHEYAEEWASRIVAILYTPRKDDTELLFYHSRLPIEFTVSEWRKRYPVEEYTRSFDYLTLTAHVEPREDV